MREDSGAIEVVRHLLGDAARLDEPIGSRTTYRVGGRAACLVEVGQPAELTTVAEAVRESGIEVLVIGKGSNLLVAESGFDGLALVLGEGFTSFAVDLEAGIVEAGGALALPVLARRSAAAGVHGLEWAVGIPGSVGGAVRMNAGGHGAETVESLIDAEIFRLATGVVETVAVGALELSYRRSALGPLDVVCSARFSVAPGDPAESLAEIERIVAWRRANQPGGRNGGSVFANPPGDSAGRLIEAAGLKGFRIASAYVSEKHANFFGVDDDGSSDDVRALIDHVQRCVEARFGVTLRTELRLIGFEHR